MSNRVVRCRDCRYARYVKDNESLYVTGASYAVKHRMKNPHHSVDIFNGSTIYKSFLSQQPAIPELSTADPFGGIVYRKVE